jgi:hypothetical protein
MQLFAQRLRYHHPTRFIDDETSIHNGMELWVDPPASAIIPLFRACKTGPVVKSAGHAQRKRGHEIVLIINNRDGGFVGVTEQSLFAAKRLEGFYPQRPSG